MKKQLLAIAVATAMAAPAMADIKVSGRVGMHYTDADLNGGGSATTFGDAGQTRLQFDGTAGKAYARIALDERLGRANHDHGIPATTFTSGGPTTPTSTFYTLAGNKTGKTDLYDKTKRDQYVGYKFDWGSIQAGRMGGVLKNLEKDPLIATFLQVRGGAGVVGAGANNAGINNWGSLGRYGSSSFIDNVVQVAGKVGGAKVKVQYGATDTDPSSSTQGHIGISIDGKIGPARVWIGTNNSLADAIDPDSVDIMKLGASMKFGKVKATLQLENVSDNADGDVDNILLMLNMGLGNGWSGDFAYGQSDMDGVPEDATMWRLGLIKKLNKSASFYVGTKNDDYDTVDFSTTGVGMTVKF